MGDKCTHCGRDICDTTELCACGANIRAERAEAKVRMLEDAIKGWRMVAQSIGYIEDEGGGKCAMPELPKGWKIKEHCLHTNVGICIYPGRKLLSIIASSHYYWLCDLCKQKMMTMYQYIEYANYYRTRACHDKFIDLARAWVEWGRE